MTARPTQLFDCENDYGGGEVLTEEIDRALKEALADAKTAAEVGDTTALANATRRAEKAQTLAAQVKKLELEVERLRAPEPQQARTNGSIVGELSAKAHGEQRRRRWVAEHAPSLKHEKGQIYRGESGARVGIAFATERQPNKWFLGLPAESFDEAVLLCETEEGDLDAFLLDERFLHEYGALLTRSGAGVKFNPLSHVGWCRTRLARRSMNPPAELRWRVRTTELKMTGPRPERQAVPSCLI